MCLYMDIYRPKQTYIYTHTQRKQRKQRLSFDWELAHSGKMIAVGREKERKKKRKHERTLET